MRNSRDLEKRLQLGVWAWEAGPWGQEEMSRRERGEDDIQSNILLNSRIQASDTLSTKLYF